MKTYNTSNVRNVVLLGSSKSGKTTFAETMMFEGKVIERRGTIEGKNTMSDIHHHPRQHQPAAAGGRLHRLRPPGRPHRAAAGARRPAA